MIVGFRCICGRLHTILRKEVIEGLGVNHWKCAHCRRRFVIACTPAGEGQPEDFWPIYLENTAPSGTTREDGLATTIEQGPSSPSELRFQCRCSCNLIAKKDTFGHPVCCPKCTSKIVLQVGYRPDTGAPIAIPTYPDDLEGKPSDSPLGI